VKAVLTSSVPTSLMLDFNQSLDPSRPAAGSPASRPTTCAGSGRWRPKFRGHARVRATSAISIQAGENWWFPRGFAEAIAAGASDFIMPDLMKVGGITGWLRVAGQAEAASIPMSSHLFAEASSHMLAVTPTAHWLEVLDLARAILAEPIEIVDGTVTARGPGLGLAWDEAAVSKYLV
jgi:mandelate racemase